MKRIFESAVQAANFNGRALFRDLESHLSSHADFGGPIEILHQHLPRRLADDVLLCIIRFCFLIELVKTPKIETTKFEVRWAQRLGEQDVRYASYEECVLIFASVLGELADAVEDPNTKELLDLFKRHRLVPYEIPLDYVSRLMDTPIHRASNIRWFWGDIPKKAVQLRHFLLSESTNPHHEVFHRAYKNKIKVKIFLTDRVLTGAHKTNREKRWETHPASVHFATRRDCLDIETTLIDQLCHFQGFPEDLFESLVERGLISESDDVFRCPITMDPLSYDDFRQEILNPDHGRAAFQVGHLNPLKAINDDPCSGHTARNISWISYDGNRIQGSLSLEEARTLIKHIASNYERFGIR